MNRTHVTPGRHDGDPALAGRDAQRVGLRGRLLDTKSIAGVGLLLVAGFGVLGAWTALDPEFMGGYLRLNGEWTVPAAFSGLLLAAGAVAAATMSSIHWRANERPFRWFAFAGVLAWMGTDEILTIHERIERAAGIDWQLAYLPIVAVAAVSWALLVRQLELHGRLLMVGGATAWLVSQLLELMQWQGDEKQAFYTALMIPEEVLEMCGSLLFLVALVAHLQRTKSAVPLAARR